MLFSSGFNFVCRFAGQESFQFHVRTHHSDFSFLKLCGILEFAEIRELKNKIRITGILSLCSTL